MVRTPSPAASPSPSRALCLCPSQNPCVLDRCTSIWAPPAGTALVQDEIFLTVKRSRRLIDPVPNGEEVEEAPSNVTRAMVALKQGGFGGYSVLSARRWQEMVFGKMQGGGGHRQTDTGRELPRVTVT